MQADWRDPDNLAFTPLIDHEMGGVALNNGTQGLLVKKWTLSYVEPNFLLGASDVPAVTVFSRAATVSRVALAFDQNMRPCIAFVKDSVPWLYWYDSLVESFVFTELAAGIADPCLCMDDKRPLEIVSNDIILAYTFNGNLYFRAQRDRFGVEYLLATDVPGVLTKVGMNRGNRLQFELTQVSG